MLKHVYHFHWFTTLLILCVSAVGFFYGSYNLYFVFQANFAFIAEHGADAVREGALVQLVELLASTGLAAVCYVSIKVCERVLVDRVLRG